MEMSGVQSVQWCMGSVVGVLSSLRLYVAMAIVSMMGMSSIDNHVGNSGMTANV